MLGHTEPAVSPVVTFTPHWRRIFTGESITMTCDVGSTGGRDLTYIWYKDGTWVDAGKLFFIRSANTWYNGDYSCQAGTKISETARLDVVVDPLILQVPLFVHEGDDLTLRCHHRSGYTETKNTTFYKDGSVIQGWRNTSVLYVGIVNMKNIGNYKCTKEINYKSTYTSFTDETFISIQNLFEIPEIKVTPYPVVEGDGMTLTCDTRLSPLRPRTQLKFSFHKDGWNVREFTSYNQYGVQSVQVKDSGKYSCEVTTATNSVKKRSQEILVEINELFFTPVLNISTFEVLKGDTVTLTCNTSLSRLRQRTVLQFAFYRDRQNVQEFSLSDQYGIRSAQLEDSGNYFCEVRSAANISKRSEDVLVQIKGEKDADYTFQNIIRLLASGIIILIVAFIFYSNMKTVRVSKTRNVKDADERVEEHQLSSQ